MSKPLVCFVGGASDRQHGNMWHVYDGYKRARQGSAHDYQYFAWDEHARIIGMIAAATGPICLIGHSWGGDTVLDVVHRAVGRPIALVITLDPVARFTQWICVPSHVGRWINVRVDITRGGNGNWVAELGGHYGPRSGADRDIFMGDRVVTEASGRRHYVGHIHANWMFLEVEPDVRNFENGDFFRSGALGCR